MPVAQNLKMKISGGPRVKTNSQVLEVSQLREEENMM